jgi:hypothetical protein
MTMFNTPVPALYSSDSSEVRVMMIGSDVSRVEYEMNVVMIKFDDESTQIVPEGHLNPIVYSTETSHEDECTCDDCYADLDELTQQEIDDAQDPSYEAFMRR